jgi:hypothetical protein
MIENKNEELENKPKGLNQFTRESIFIIPFRLGSLNSNERKRGVGGIEVNNKLLANIKNFDC